MTELVFIVDGDARASELAFRCLTEVGYTVRIFSRLADFKEVGNAQPSLILIAAVLRDGSGLELCRQIRQNPAKVSTAVILLTTGTSEEQSCAALEAGADHCLAKPFNSRELMARVQAALRHVGHPFPHGKADIVIDHRAMKLSVRGNEVLTTTLEFRLLNYLAQHRGYVFTRDVLLDAVWGQSRFVTPRSVDACIRRVREKIEPDITRPTYLKTIRGIGYRFDAVAVWPSSGEQCDCFVCAPTNGRTASVEPPRVLSRRSAPLGHQAKA